MTSLLDLPLEIVMLIIDGLFSHFETEPGNKDIFLATQKDLNTLSQTNKWFYAQLEIRLYNFNLQHGGQTSLAFGAFHGHETVVQKSLATSAPDTIPSVAFSTRDCGISHVPLCWAVQGGQISMVDSLIQSGADIHKNCVDTRCDAQLLSQAARFGHLDLMKDLVRRGLRPTIKWENHFTRPRDELVDNDDTRYKATLRLAAENGHLDCVDYTLSVGDYQDLSCKQYMHRIALIVPATVANGHMECAMFLLSRSDILKQSGFCRCASKPARALVSDLPRLTMALEDPSIMEKYGHMLLYLAAATGCSSLLREVVQRGINIDTRFRGGNTPLCLAIIERGNSVSIQSILALGADINVKNSQKRNPLYLATMFRSTDIMMLLLDEGANVNETGPRSGIMQTPLLRAVDDFNFFAPSAERARRTLHSPGNEVLSLLLEHGADPNYVDPTHGITPLWLAVRATYRLEKRYSLVQLLLEHGADPKLATRNQSVLFWSIPAHDYNTTKILLEHGADPNDYGRNFDGSKTHHRGKPLSPLAKAMKARRYETAELLLDHGADPHAPYWKTETSLVKATKSMRCSFIEKMIDKGFDVNESVGAQKPLHVAVWKGNVEVAELLLRRGADPNITVGGTSRQSSRSLLWWASHQNLTAVVELLCAHGARQLPDADTPGDFSPISKDSQYDGVEYSSSLFSDDP
ncbi:hypothetical protein N7457_008963 [Penicillium paradoxum]|uniref:uncharacterized protein n=1 Tax=Penicillium paradoxum TaxID=176176 RepID=UPI002549BF0D|nr:uncharacterized protein N7457_008963 [Penicillium paradoxum]KAJ5774067.1 hypothetical protein N7457_008963 [Penicillium paradoxum]